MRAIYIITSSNRSRLTPGLNKVDFDSFLTYSRLKNTALNERLIALTAALDSGGTGPETKANLHPAGSCRVACSSKLEISALNVSSFHGQNADHKITVRCHG